MSEQHCAGCHGHVRGEDVPCPGAAAPDGDDSVPEPQIAGFRLCIHHHLTRLPWRSRIKILLGLRVCTEIDIESGSGEFADITDLVTGSDLGPDDLTGP